MAVLLLVLCLGAAMLFLFPPSSGRLPEIEGENAVSEKLTVQADGSGLGAIILSKDSDNPVLLVCGGGPGIPQYLIESMLGSPLTDVFTVCYWDYRGTGLSYSNAISSVGMTTEKFIGDTLRMTDYLACANGLLQGRAGGRNRILSGTGVRITAKKAHAVSLKGIQSFPPAIIFTSASIALLRLLPL